MYFRNVDFACWCSYKYLNGGPGAPGAIFVHKKWCDSNEEIKRFTGWWGNKRSNRFDMKDAIDLCHGAYGWQLSNPPVLVTAALSFRYAHKSISKSTDALGKGCFLTDPLQAMSSLRASLKVHTDASMKRIREKSVLITGYLESLLSEELNGLVDHLTPKNVSERGAQLSLVFHQSIDVEKVGSGDGIQC